MTNLETRKEQQNKMNELLNAIRRNGGVTGVFRIDDTETFVISIVGGRFGEDASLEFSPLVQESIAQAIDTLEAYVAKMETAISKEEIISSWERALH